MDLHTLYNMEKQSPLITFIITSYDTPAELLAECIESISKFSLNTKEREIILIDDGSYPLAINAIPAMKDEILYIRTKHQGVSMARNYGIQMARGKYIQFVDGHDKLLNAPYEHCLDIARFHDPDIVCFEQTNQPDVDTPFTFSTPIPGNIYLHNNVLKPKVCHYLFKRKLLINLRFSLSTQQEDEEFTPQLFLRADKIISTKSEAYLIRKSNRPTQKNKSKKLTISKLQDTEKAIYHLQELSYTMSTIDSLALQRRIAELSVEYLHQVILTTKSARHLEEAVCRLHEKGLFPLPEKDYSRQYRLLRKGLNSRRGRKLLVLALPKLESWSKDTTCQ